jgi:hypothetical protein
MFPLSKSLFGTGAGAAATMVARAATIKYVKCIVLVKGRASQLSKDAGEKSNRELKVFMFGFSKIDGW